MTPTRLVDVPNSLPCLPFGRINSARKHSRQAACFGALPVLEGGFQLGKMKRESNLPISLSWGVIDLAEAPLPILVFTLQLGTDVMYWLANPCDPEIWKMIDEWAAAGSMAVAVRLPSSSIFASAEFELQWGAQELRSKAFAAMKDSPPVAGFTETALGLFLSGRVQSGTTSSIASIPSVRQVQACTVRTQTTAVVSVPHQDMVTTVSGCSFLRQLVDGRAS